MIPRSAVPIASPAPTPRCSSTTSGAILLNHTDPEGNQKGFTYNSRDQVETTKDPRGQLTQNFYDANGNLEKTIDAGETTRHVSSTTATATSPSKQ